MNINFEKGAGLVPVIVQDDTTGQILMLGYMSSEAFEATVSSGLVTFFSRSRRELWVKGETSGNYLHYQRHLVDCDGDTLIVFAKPDGPVCHTGSQTCFVDSSDGSFGFLGALESIIADRATSGSEESYTNRLLKDGPGAAAQKVGEEGVEVALAAVSQSDDDVLNESADLLYHLLVVLRSRGLSLSQVAKILADRHKTDD